MAANNSTDDIPTMTVPGTNIPVLGTIMPGGKTSVVFVIPDKKVIGFTDSTFPGIAVRWTSPTFFGIEMHDCNCKVVVNDAWFDGSRGKALFQEQGGRPEPPSGPLRFLAPLIHEAGKECAAFRKFQTIMPVPGQTVMSLWAHEEMEGKTVRLLPTLMENIQRADWDEIRIMYQVPEGKWAMALLPW